MIDYVGLNILAGIYAIMLGYEIGRFLQDCHYRKLLRRSSEDYNDTIRGLRERYDLLAMENKRLRHDCAAYKTTIPTDTPPDSATQTLKDFNPRTVTIGDATWMQENLAIDDGGEGITCNPDNGQYYYTWDAAMRVAESIPGWHLPTAEEWNAAAEACGAEAVDNRWKDDPNMRDYTGTQKLYDTLRVLPVGYYYGGSFSLVGSYACFWSATEYDSSRAYDRYFDTSDALRQRTGFKDSGFSVRLVKD